MVIIRSNIQKIWLSCIFIREDELNVSDADSAKYLALFNRAALSVIMQHQSKKRQHDEQAALRRLESNISLRITIWLNHEQSRIPP
ncbi:MAG: hypothetical protein WAqPseu_35230 [Shewanella algae]